MTSLSTCGHFFRSVSSLAVAAALGLQAGAAAAGTVTVQQSMDDLWNAHMEWTYATVAAFADDSPDLGADLNRLLQNQQDIGNSMKAYYGDQYGTALAALLTTHINDAVPVLVAARNDDTAALNTAVAAWYDNATRIGNLLAAANPQWAKEGMAEMWRTHITQTIAYSVDLLNADPDQAIVDYDMARMHMIMMGQMLSEGLMGGLSTQLYPDMQSALINDTRHLRDAVLDRLDETCAGDTHAHSSEGECRTGFWISPFGAWGHLDGDDGTADLHHDVTGFFMGVDRTVGQGWRVGVVGGYAHGRSDLDDFGSSSTNDSYQLGLYAGTRWGDWHFNAGAAYAWNDVKSDRQVIDLPGFQDRASGKYDLHTAQIFGELGKDLQLGSATLTPFLRAAYVDMRSDGFDEAGDDAAVQVESGHDDVGFSTLGLRARDTVYRGGATSIDLHGLIGWEHALGGVTPDTTFVFSNDVRMTQEGVPLARDALDLQAGADVLIGRRMRVSLDYTGQIGNHVVESGAMARATIIF